MLDTSNDSKKIVITCRFIQHDQWLTTHIEPSWTIRQLKLWLIHRFFQISIPSRVFAPAPRLGTAAERPPSPITFAPDPRTRPASPIVFAPPQKVGGYAGAGRGWLSDTDEDLLSGSDDDSLSGFSSAGRGKWKGKAKAGGDEVRIGQDYPGTVPGGRIGPSQAHSDAESTPGHSNSLTSPTYTAPDADRFPGGVNPHHWNLTRYSTGQLLTDDDSLVEWFSINEFELIELHGLSFPSTHALYEYQVYHLWNPDRHRERERLRKKLKKRFEAETKEAGKDGKEEGGRAARQAQILKAMNLNSGAGANVGVVEYYGAKLSNLRVEMTLTRIPRSIDTYVQPYWEGWVRTLRIVWRGAWSEYAAGAGTANQAMDTYRYGVYSAGTTTGGLGMGVNVYHYGLAQNLGGSTGESNRRDKKRHSMQYPSRLVRVEWRERWVRIQNGTLAVLRDRESGDATHILPLKDIVSLRDTQHLVRYLAYTGFNPPVDHPAVTPDILIPALNPPIPRPQQSVSGLSDTDSDDPLRPPHHSNHGHGHGSGHGHHHGSSVGSSKEYNFSFPNATHLQRHVKARELTPLVGSRFDPTYLPITIEEQKASGLRVVCLQFRKHSSTSISATTPAANPSTNNNNLYGEAKNDDKEADDEEERERQTAIDPITLALEDMKERAGEWGGVRSNGPLWRCPRRLRPEPMYLTRAKTRMRMRSSRDVSRRRGAGGGGRGASGEFQGGKNVDENSTMTESTGGDSTIRGLGEPIYLEEGYYHPYKHRTSANGKRPTHGAAGGRGPIPSRSRKDRIYKDDHDQRLPSKSLSHDTDLDIHGMLAAQIFGGGIPSKARSYKEVVEERERKEKKERRKREKELEKERAKQEKELREREKEKGKGKEKEKEDKDKDWGLGSLNVAFWNWGKKKRAKKEMERESRMQIQHEREIKAQFAAAAAAPTTPIYTPSAASGSASTSTVQLSAAGHEQGTVSEYGTDFRPHFASRSVSTNTITTATTATDSGGGATSQGMSSTTVVGGACDTAGGSVGSAGASSGEDDDDDTQIEFASWDRGRSETSGVESTEEDEELDEEEPQDEEDSDDDHDIVEPYPDDVSDHPVKGYGADEEEEVEYADQPSASQIRDPNRDLEIAVDKSKNSGGLDVPNVIVQVEVDKRVEREMDMYHRSRSRVVKLGGRIHIPSRETAPPVSGLPPADRSSPGLASGLQMQGQGMVQGQAQGTLQGMLTKKPSQRLIGQLHSSDDERGVENRENEDDDAELSSPVFAPPHHSRSFRSLRSPSTSGHGHGDSTCSASSHGSSAPLQDEGTGEEYENDDDLDLDDGLFVNRRAGYRYGLYETRREDKKKRTEYERELEDQSGRGVKIREQQELETRQRDHERQEKEREREKKERRKRDDEGEWVCLDVGNDFAFQSLLRIVHQHCPHPMKSSFMDRLMGEPLNDAPPPPQALPQPLTANAYSGSTNNSVGPSSPSAHSHRSRSQPKPRPVTSTNIGSIFENREPSTRLSVPNSPASPRSHHTTSSHSSYQTPASHSVPSSSSPSDLSAPAPSTPSSHNTPPSPSPSPSSSEVQIDSETEYVAPLPGYGDPRFTYPSRAFATPPYPEWRLNVLRKAQRAGMGDVGRAMEMLHWGREDPVVAGASGAMFDSEQMGKRWGTRGGFGGFQNVKDQGKGKKRESAWSGGIDDNVSSLGTVGPRTVGSGGTVKGVQIGSPTRQRKRLSLGGKSARSAKSTGSSKGIPEVLREGGESGNESSREDSDGSMGSVTSASSAGGEKKAAKSHKTVTPTSGMPSKLSKWSDEEEEHGSELEWLAWQIDVRRQAKRQYAIQARREAKTAYGMGAEPDLNIPVDPTSDMKKYLENRKKMEPSAAITLPKRPPEGTDVSTSSLVVSNSLSGGTQATNQRQWSGATTSIIATSSSTRVAADTLSPHHARTPSQHTLHHSASLHTGLRKGPQDLTLRRPSMPILTTNVDPKERDKGKGKERSFWGHFSASSSVGGYGNDESKSPTTAGSSWFPSRRPEKDEKDRDKDRELKELLSPTGSVSQPASAGGSVGKSGSILLKGGLLRKKDSGDVTRDKEKEREREKEKTKSSEGEMKKGQRPQLWVATSSSTASSSATMQAAESSRSPEHVKSPTFASKRFVKRMRSDASLLSLRGEVIPEAPPQQQHQPVRKKQGPMDKFFTSAMDFADGK